MKQKLRKIVLPASRTHDKWIVNDLVMCAHCFFQWTAVYPYGTDVGRLECKKCGGKLTIIGGK